MRRAPTLPLAGFAALAVAAWVEGCAHHSPAPPLTPPIVVAPPPARPMVRVDPPALADDLPLAPLLDAAAAQADWLERSAKVARFAFGELTVDKADYLADLRHFVALGRAAATPAAFHAAIKREFVFFASPDDLLVTSYFEPVLDGARAPSARFSQPLYGPPAEATARQPTFTRAQIDREQALAGRGLELCWVDPFDAFVLQTEGSGTVAFSDGKLLPLDYAGNNGQPHRRLGPYLKETLAKGKGPLNLHTMEAYLRSLPVDEMRQILEKNPRYVFFQPRRGSGPSTSLGLPATDGRTLASDPNVYPKGALGFLVTEQPRMNGTDVESWYTLTRFVLDQDTGSGIIGAHVDLYWGRGADAGRIAGVMKQRGRLYYLLGGKSYTAATTKRGLP